MNAMSFRGVQLGGETGTITGIPGIVTKVISVLAGGVGAGLYSVGLA